MYPGNDTMRDWQKQCQYTQEEMIPVSALCVEWMAARERRDFAVADTFRAQLLDAGVLLDTVSADGSFAVGPMNESPAHRQQRLQARKR